MCSVLTLGSREELVFVGRSTNLMQYIVCIFGHDEGDHSQFTLLISLLHLLLSQGLLIPSSTIFSSRFI